MTQKKSIPNRANAPYQAMDYPDFPYPNYTTSFPSHDDVWKYLNSYAKEFDIRKHIKFHHVFEQVTPIEKKLSKTMWKISAKYVPNNKHVYKTYDAVFVCTGSCTKPYIPKIKGEFKGRVLHSRKYRKAQEFQGLLYCVLN